MAKDVPDNDLLLKAGLAGAHLMGVPHDNLDVDCPWCTLPQGFAGLDLSQEQTDQMVRDSADVYLQSLGAVSFGEADPEDMR